MRLPSIFKRLDRGFLVVLAISLVAVWPFLSRASLPQATDAELHIFRLHELSYLLRNGEFFPRWAPNFYHGYGYPIFNYYAPLTYYLALPLDLLPKIGPVTAVKSIFVLSLLLASVGMYGFVRDNWGRTAGFVAAAAYLYAPYVQYIDPLARGVLPETFSLGLFPIALWMLDRLGRQQTPWRWLSAVLALAAVLLSHNLLGPFFFGILLAWVIWQAIGQYIGQPTSQQVDTQPNRLVPIRSLFLALLLSLFLSFFFWLPVFAEQNAVNLTTLIGKGDNFDFRTHFLSWRELLTYSRRLDWGASEPFFVFNLGIAQWVFAGAGVGLVLLRRVKKVGLALFFVVGTAVLLFLLQPAATIVWESVPILPYFQFPWRLLGPTAAMLAILAGVAVSEIKQPWLVAGLVALPLLLGIPLSQPAPWPEFGEVSTRRMSDIEHQGRWLGTTSTADYVPATVDIIPERNGNLIAGIYAGLPLDRVNRAEGMLPAGATVISEQLTPLSFRYQVLTPHSFQLRLFLFQFPGWQVTLDGERIIPELGRPEGFIVVPVPAGEHVVTVEFGSTPPRTAGTAISLIALGGLAYIMYQAQQNSSSQKSQRTVQTGAARILSEGEMRPVLTAILVLIAGFLLLQPTGWLHYNSVGFEAKPAQRAVQADFGQQIVLLGYDTTTAIAAPGEELTVTLYWKAERPLDLNYQVFVHVLAADGFLQVQSDKLNPGEFPTRRWPLDKYIRDVHTLQLPLGLASGEYQVMVGVWSQYDGWRLPLLDETGQQVDDKVQLFTLTVE